MHQSSQQQSDCDDNGDRDETRQKAKHQGAWAGLLRSGLRQRGPPFQKLLPLRLGLFPMQLRSLPFDFCKLPPAFGKTDFRQHLLGSESAFFLLPPRPDFRQKTLDIFDGDVKPLGNVRHGGAVGEASCLNLLLLPEVNNGAGLRRRHPLGAGRCRAVYRLLLMLFLRHVSILAYLYCLKAARAGSRTKTLGAALFRPACRRQSAPSARRCRRRSLRLRGGSRGA